MSIVVEQLSKFYGEQAAVNKVSFKVNKGEVVGFLGPNGAGKSTTMKILTCYIKQNEGTASVCGLDTATEGLAVRRKIGYLPEHNPLYKELYVKEFLGLCARFYSLKRPANRIKEIIELTGLGREQHKKIEELSRGYRQRVGLAQAILHNPEVLILDEPTSGLDPNQIVDIRNLIKDLGREKTVIFSSHIMQEVEAICDRVLIIDKGKLVMDAPIDEIRGVQKKDFTVLSLVFEGIIEEKILRKIPGLEEARNIDGGKWLVKGRAINSIDFRQNVFQFCASKGWVMLEMSTLTTSMEEVFRELTNKK